MPVRTETFFDPLARQFLARYTKSATINAYSTDLSRWSDWCHKRAIAPLSMTADEAVAYRDDLAAAGLAKNTQARILSACSTFCRWCVANNRMESNPFDTMKRPQAETAPKRWISAEQLARFCTVAAQSGDSDWLALAVLCGRRGMRVSEALAARWDDLSWHGSRRVLRVRDAKTGERMVPLAAGDMRRLNRSPHREGLFIANTAGEQRTGAWACNATKQIAGLARIPDADEVTPHVLRRSCAMLWLTESNGDIWATSKLLGHASITTTAHYLQAHQASNLNVLDLSDERLDRFEADADWTPPKSDSEVASTLWNDTAW